MLYLIYKITNKLNGKYYIGCHKTEDEADGYMGSGKLISKAIGKHGLDNFTKEIIERCGSETEMFQREAELVIIDREKTYNLQSGGRGGWGYINESKLGGHHVPHTEEAKQKIKASSLGRVTSAATKKLISERNKLTNKSRGRAVSKALKGKPKSPEHRENIRQAILKRSNRIAA